MIYANVTDYGGASDDNYRLLPDFQDFKNPDTRLFVKLIQNPDKLKRKKWIVLVYLYNTTKKKTLQFFYTTTTLTYTTGLFNPSEDGTGKKVYHKIYSVKATPHILKLCNIIEPKRPLGDGYPTMPNCDYTLEGIPVSVIKK